MSESTSKEIQNKLNAANKFIQTEIEILITICRDLGNIKTGLIYLSLSFCQYQKEVNDKSDFKKSAESFCAIIIAGYNNKFYYTLLSMITQDAIKIAANIQELFTKNLVNEIYNLLESDETNRIIKELARLADNNMIHKVVENRQMFCLTNYDDYDSVGTYKNEDTDITSLFDTSKPQYTEKKEKKKKGCLFWICLIALLILMSLGIEKVIHSFYQTEFMQEHFKKKAYERYMREKSHKYYQ